MGDNGEIDLDFGDSGQTEEVAGSEEDGELLEDGEVAEDSGDDEAPPVPFRPKDGLEPGEAPMTPGELSLARQPRPRRLSTDLPLSPPVYEQPYPPFPPFQGPYPPEAWPSRTADVLCKFYVRGGCAFGDECKFAHPPGQGGSMPPLPPRMPRPPFPHPHFMGPGGMMRMPLRPYRGIYHQGPPRFPPMMMGPDGFPMVPGPPPFLPQPPPVEESWEAGLRKAKELLKKSGKIEAPRKEGVVEGVRDTPTPTEEPISGDEAAQPRPKTPPTPDPESFFGPMHGPPPPHAPPPVPPAERPPPALSYRPSRDEYESYIPPPRNRPEDASPPLSPRGVRGPSRGSQGERGGHTHQDSSRRRPLPPPPKERNHAHPPPKIFKGTSAGPARRPDERYPPARSPPTSPTRVRRSSRELETLERRSRERELRKQEFTRNARKGRTSESSGREGTRPLPYEREANGSVSGGGGGAEWQDPWDRRGKGRRRRRRSSASSSSSKSSRASPVRRRHRSDSLDSVSSIDSYDSQKEKGSPRIDQRPPPTARQPTGKLKDLLTVVEKVEKVEKNVGISEDSEDSEDEEAKKVRRLQLLEQLKAVEEQIAKKRDK